MAEELKLLAELRLNLAARPAEMTILVEEKVNEIVRTVNELVQRELDRS